VDFDGSADGFTAGFGRGCVECGEGNAATVLAAATTAAASAAIAASAAVAAAASVATAIAASIT
jgi:hypothetical protein